jgi:hypothetical protein
MAFLTSFTNFGDVITFHFLNMFQQILERETLTSLQGPAAIRLIPKCSGVCGTSGVWPVSLLNCDYRVMAFVLAGRSRQTLLSAVGPHQKDWLPCRVIFDNLSLYRDFIQYVENRRYNESTIFSIRGIGAATAWVDFENACDMVNRENH